MDNIMLIKSCKRRENIDSVQKILTEFGCIISMRLGLHETCGVCSEEGLILLHLVDNTEEIKNLEAALKKVDCVTVKTVQI